MPRFCAWLVSIVLVIPASVRAGEDSREGEPGIGEHLGELVGLYRHLHSHPDLREAMGRRARSAVQERWTWRHYEQRVARVWSELLADGLD